jgi:serine/threonine protein kinase
MMNNDHTYIASIFDDDVQDYTMWKKNPSALKKYSELKIIEGLLFKQSNRTNFWKSRFYVLFEDRLACYNNGREKKEKAYCHFHNMRVEKISCPADKEDKFGIRFMHNGQYFDLYARAKDLQEKWIQKLKEFCVMTNYNSAYLNHKVIGKGSFAKVYLGKRKIDNLEFAVKTFDKAAIIKQDKAKPSLINEINIMRRLDHENIIKLYEVYESATHICLVLELLHGGELFNKITKKGRYTERDASLLMKKLLDALEYLHQKGIMHRDIKLENLILKEVDNDIEIKIVDFGLATFCNQSEFLFRRCGTPGYVAPEVLMDEKYDQKVDVFSAGVIMYILLTGGSPFYGKSYNEILHKNKKCEIRFDFAERGKKISPPAVDLLKKMLAKDPKVRITTKEALSHDWVMHEGDVPVEDTSVKVSTPQMNGYLLSAQENMKKFQEERFNVKNIKPKDLDQKSMLEQSWHCPSPIINGQIITVADSHLFSPKTPIMNSNGETFTPNRQPIGMQSPMVTPNMRNARDTPIIKPKVLAPGMMFQNHDVDNIDMISDDNSNMARKVAPYMYSRTGANGVLMQAQRTNATTSTNSSVQGSAPNKKRTDERDFKKRAIAVQEQLMSYLKNIEAPKPTDNQMMMNHQPQSQQPMQIQHPPQPIPNSNPNMQQQGSGKVSENIMNQILQEYNEPDSPNSNSSNAIPAPETIRKEEEKKVSNVKNFLKNNI